MAQPSPGDRVEEPQGLGVSQRVPGQRGKRPAGSIPVDMFDPFSGKTLSLGLMRATREGTLGKVHHTRNNAGVRITHAYTCLEAFFYMVLYGACIIMYTSIYKYHCRYICSFDHIRYGWAASHAQRLSEHERTLTSGLPP